MDKKHIPNYLTVFRIILTVPVVFCLSLESSGGYLVSAVLWLVACGTDILDGYLSRKWNTQSVMGALLDPTADKILNLSVMVFLVSQQELPVLLVMLLMSRDIYVSGVRAIAADKNLILYASPLAQWKTAIEMVALFVLLIGIAFSITYLQWASVLLLWICVFMSWISAINYTLVFYNKLSK